MQEDIREFGGVIAGSEIRIEIVKKSIQLLGRKRHRRNEFGTFDRLPALYA